MKLCQKCIDAIKKVVPLDYDIRIPKPDIFQEPVPESECEFWVHKEVNEIIKDFNEVVRHIRHVAEVTSSP